MCMHFSTKKVDNMFYLENFGDIFRLGTASILSLRYEVRQALLYHIVLWHMLG